MSAPVNDSNLAPVNPPTVTSTELSFDDLDISPVVETAGGALKALTDMPETKIGIQDKSIKVFSDSESRILAQAFNLNELDQLRTAINPLLAQITGRQEQFTNYAVDLRGAATGQPVASSLNPASLFAALRGGGRDLLHISDGGHVVYSSALKKLAEEYEARHGRAFTIMIGGKAVPILHTDKKTVLTDDQHKAIVDTMRGTLLSILQMRINALEEMEKKIRDKKLEEERELERDLQAKTLQKESSSHIANPSAIFEANAQALLKAYSARRDAVKFMLEEDFTLEAASQRRVEKKRHEEKESVDKMVLDKADLQKRELKEDLKKKKIS